MTSMKTIKGIKSIIIKSILLALFIAILITFAVLKKNSDIAESFTTSFARTYQKFMGQINSNIPFSISEVLFVIIALTTLVLLILIIVDLCKLKFIKAISKTLTIALMFVVTFTCYNVSCELAYNRSNLKLDYYEEKVDKSLFKDIVTYFIDDFNFCSSMLNYKDSGEVINPYKDKALYELVKEEYKKLTDDYYSSYTPTPKKMFLSFLFREFQITGLYFAPFGEVNYNRYTTNGELPFTIAHEIAHSKGVMRENDAQMVAAYITLNSNDYYLRYSGYIYTFSSIFSLSYYTGNKDDPSELNKLISDNIKKNNSYIYSYWNKHNLLSNIGNWFNDIYLKLSGTGKGTADYGDTPVEVDQTTHEITSFSNYQKLYLATYFKNKA